MSQLLYDATIKAMGGDKLQGKGDQKYTNWSPNNIRYLVILPEGVMAVPHLGKSPIERVKLNPMLAMEEVNGRFKNPFEAFFFKQISCLEAIFIDERMFQALSSKSQRFQSRYRDGKFRFHAILPTPANLSGTLFNSDKGQVLQILEEGAKSGQGIRLQKDFKKTYNLVPGVYQMDGASLKEHFDEISGAKEEALDVPAIIRVFGEKTDKAEETLNNLLYVYNALIPRVRKEEGKVALSGAGTFLLWQAKQANLGVETETPNFLTYDEGKFLEINRKNTALAVPAVCRNVKWVEKKKMDTLPNPREARQLYAWAKAARKEVEAFSGGRDSNADVKEIVAWLDGVKARINSDTKKDITKEYAKGLYKVCERMIAEQGIPTLGKYIAKALAGDKASVAKVARYKDEFGNLGVYQWLPYFITDDDETGESYDFAFIDDQESVIIDLLRGYECGLSRFEGVLDVKVEADTYSGVAFFTAAIGGNKALASTYFKGVVNDTQTNEETGSGEESGGINYAKYLKAFEGNSDDDSIASLYKEHAEEFKSLPLEDLMKVELNSDLPSLFLKGLGVGGSLDAIEAAGMVYEKYNSLQGSTDKLATLKSRILQRAFAGCGEAVQGEGIKDLGYDMGMVVRGVKVNVPGLPATRFTGIAPLVDSAVLICVTLVAKTIEECNFGGEAQVEGTDFTGAIKKALTQLDD